MSASDGEGDAKKRARPNRLHTIRINYSPPAAAPLRATVLDGERAVTAALLRYAIAATSTPVLVATIGVAGGSGTYNLAITGGLVLSGGEVRIPADAPPLALPGNELTAEIVVQDSDFSSATEPVTLSLTVRYILVEAHGELRLREPATGNRLLLTPDQRGKDLNYTAPLTLWQSYHEGFSGGGGATVALVSRAGATLEVVDGPVDLQAGGEEMRLLLLARRAYGALITATLRATDGDATLEKLARPDRFYTLVAAPVLSLSAGFEGESLINGKGGYYYNEQNPNHPALRKVARVSVNNLPPNMSLTAEIFGQTRELPEWLSRGRGFYVNHGGAPTTEPLTIVFKDNANHPRLQTLPYTLKLSLTNIAISNIVWKEAPGLTPRGSSPDMILATIDYHANTNLKNVIVGRPELNDYFTITSPFYGKKILTGNEIPANLDYALSETTDYLRAINIKPGAVPTATRNTLNFQFYWENKIPGLGENLTEGASTMRLRGAVIYQPRKITSGGFAPAASQKYFMGLGSNPYRLRATRAGELENIALFNLGGFSGGVNDLGLTLVALKNDGFTITPGNNSRAWRLGISTNITPNPTKILTLAVKIDDIDTVGTTLAQYTPPVTLTLKAIYGAAGVELKSTVILNHSYPLHAIDVVTLSALTEGAPLINIASLSITIAGLREALQSRWSNFVTAYVYTTQAPGSRPLMTLRANENMEINIKREDAVAIRNNGGLSTLFIEIEDNVITRSVHYHTLALHYINYPPLALDLLNSRNNLITVRAVTNTLVTAATLHASGGSGANYVISKLSGDLVYEPAQSVILIPGSVPLNNQTLTMILGMHDGRPSEDNVTITVGIVYEKVSLLRTGSWQAVDEINATSALYAAGVSSGTITLYGFTGESYHSGATTAPGNIAAILKRPLGGLEESKEFNLLANGDAFSLHKIDEGFQLLVTNTVLVTNQTLTAIIRWTDSTGPAPEIMQTIAVLFKTIPAIDLKYQHINDNSNLTQIQTVLVNNQFPNTLRFKVASLSIFSGLSELITATLGNSLIELEENDLAVIDNSAPRNQELALTLSIRDKERDNAILRAQGALTVMLRPVSWINLQDNSELERKITAWGADGAPDITVSSLSIEGAHNDYIINDVSGQLKSVNRENTWFVIIPANTRPNNNLTLKAIVRDINNKALATTLGVTVAFERAETFQATLSSLIGFEKLEGNPLLVMAGAEQLSNNLNIITLIVRGGANPGNYDYTPVPVINNPTGLGVSSDGLVFIKSGTPKDSKNTLALTVIINDTGLGKELTDPITQTISVIYGLDNLELKTESLRADGLTAFPAILTITVANDAHDLINIATLGVTLENINSPEKLRLKEFITTYIYEALPENNPAINTLIAADGFTVDINASYALSLRNSQGRYTLHASVENKLFVTLSKQHALKVHFEPPIDYQRLTIMKLMGSTIHADESILTLPTGSPPFAYLNAYSGGDLINDGAAVLVPSGLIVDANKHLSLTIKIADQNSFGSFARVGVSLLITAVSSVRAKVLNTLEAPFVQEDIIYILKEGLSRDPNADEPRALGQARYVATVSVSGGNSSLPI